MIRQEINLYQERFHEKLLLVSARNSLFFLGFVMISLIVASLMLRSNLSGLEQHNEQLQSQRDAANQRLGALQDELNRLLADDRVDRALAEINREIRARQRMIDFVETNQFGSGKGFSSVLTALSEIKAKDLWLSEIRLAGSYFKLSGSTLDEQAIPQYFNQFRQRELFAGRVFDVFELGRSEEQDWKIDFVIASRAINHE
jgi:hypothetical protein